MIWSCPTDRSYRFLWTPLSFHDRKQPRYSRPPHIPPPVSLDIFSRTAFLQYIFRHTFHRKGTIHGLNDLLYNVELSAEGIGVKTSYKRKAVCALDDCCFNITTSINSMRRTAMTSMVSKRNNILLRPFLTRRASTVPDLPLKIQPYQSFSIRQCFGLPKKFPIAGICHCTGQCIFLHLVMHLI